MYRTWSPEALRAGIDALIRAHRSIVDRLASMDGAVRSHMADWQDDAKVAYESHKVLWDAEIQVITDVLHGGGDNPVGAVQVLENILTNNQTTEKINASQW